MAENFRILKMKTFKEYLKEAYGTGKPGWKPLRGKEAEQEQSEAIFQQKVKDQFHPAIQKALDHFADPKNYAEALRTAKIEIYNRRKLSNVSNTTGGESWWRGQKQLEPVKVKRANQQAIQQARGDLQLSMPVIVRAVNTETGEEREHNLSGNTRLSRHGDKGVPVQILRYEY